eukprot:CAMPEP_0183340282 /NCGR_PEP_ID=MMETSP0164_2-20130417/6891_1 /TAXON_ID=221442 /ORGANISM="Coccolithus pelagicus ssp braarudi, Strain PLY182g" /LENGTH=53 /DNA_ID=CAMNT_0025510397 /DNA_START=131 /DNA_END=289 /DNA_ORIENTATION=+
MLPAETQGSHDSLRLSPASVSTSASAPIDVPTMGSMHSTPSRRHQLKLKLCPP